MLRCSLCRSCRAVACDPVVVAIVDQAAGTCAAAEAAAPPPLQEARAPYRAQLHTEIAAGYYERGQMDVALQELQTKR